MANVTANSFREQLQTLVRSRITVARMPSVSVGHISGPTENPLPNPLHRGDENIAETRLEHSNNAGPPRNDTENTQTSEASAQNETWFDALETTEPAEIVIEDGWQESIIEQRLLDRTTDLSELVPYVGRIDTSERLRLDAPLVAEVIEEPAVDVDPDEPLIQFDPVNSNIKPVKEPKAVRAKRSSKRAKALKSMEPVPVKEPGPSAEILSNLQGAIPARSSNTDVETNTTAQRTEFQSGNSPSQPPMQTGLHPEKPASRPLEVLHVADEESLYKHLDVLPAWFLQNCVECCEDLHDSADSLIICNDLRADDTTLEARDSNQPHRYHIGRSMWQPLLAIHTSWADQLSFSEPVKAFSHDAALIRFPDQHREDGGSKFLKTVVDHFARQIGADLVDLSVDDILDLPTYATKGSNRIDKATAEAIVQAPSLKRLFDPDKYSQFTDAPVVVHVPDVHRIMDIKNEWAQLNELRHALAKASGNAILLTTTSKAFASKRKSSIDPIAEWIDSAREALEDEAGLPRTVLSVFEKCADKYEKYLGKGNGFQSASKLAAFDTAVLASTGSNPMKQAIRVAPYRSAGQRKLFQSDKRNESTMEQRNIRLLQRKVRTMFPATRNVELFHPFAPWEFFKGTHTSALLSAGIVGEKEMHHLLSSVYDLLEVGLFEEAILQMGSRKDTTDGWYIDGEDLANPDVWASFPAHVRAAVRQIESDPKTYKLEQQLLSQIVNPAEIRDSWSEIAVDSDIKKSITKLAQQQLGNTESSYGVLKDNRIGGAMLYGPPGTGKTHLARIVARELGVVMIAVTAADLNHMWVGQTEKSIKALFSLARMIAPSMIFVDEADALLRGRKSQDHAHHRIAMNQLLQEMDGLNKSATAPFVLISTNFPRDLDHAVLRRVPRRIHIGLPSPTQREKIFRICLKDEAIADDVDIVQLATLSRGFSGSDITTVCVQAALFCDTMNDGRRVLQKRHFRKAFRKCTTSVSKMGLTAIQGFAREFDPETFEKLVREGLEGPAPISTALKELGDSEDDVDSDSDSSTDIGSENDDDADYKRALKLSKAEAKEADNYKRALEASLAESEFVSQKAPSSPCADDDNDDNRTLPPYSKVGDSDGFDDDHALQISNTKAEATAVHQATGNQAHDISDDLALAIKLSLEEQHRSRTPQPIYPAGSCFLQPENGYMNPGPAATDADQSAPEDFFRQGIPIEQSMPGVFRYAPLRNYPPELRLLSIVSNEDTSSWDRQNSCPQCIIRTVQLDDWTDDYKAFNTITSNMDLPASAKFQLLLWHRVSEKLSHQEMNLNPAELEREIREVSNRMLHSDDLQLIPGIPIKHRYRWGDYCALSYEWGDPAAPTKSIMLNGCQFQVTPNLYRALLDLQNSDELRKRELLVWIDGLCINQNDLAERAIEVQRMAKIYSNSQLVRAHVGYPPPTIAAEVPTIRGFLDATDGLPINEINWTTIQEADALEAMIPVTMSMASCAFWKRLWIMQEIALAPAILLYYGNRSFTTREVYNLCQLLPRGWVAGHFRKFTARELEDFFELSDRVRMRMVTLRPHAETGIEHAPLGIVDLICLSQSADATDPRDKIYGLHALLPEIIQQRIKPNYSLSSNPWRLLIEFSRACIEAESDLSFLSRISRPPMETHLPSWTVYLFTSGDVTGFTTPKNSRTHRANKGFSPAKQIFSHDGRIMSCQGVIVDSIAELGAFRRFSHISEWEEETSFEYKVGSVKPPIPPGTDWRRTAARVITQDADFEFSDLPNIFDIPWLPQRSIARILGHNPDPKEIPDVPHHDWHGTNQDIKTGTKDVPAYGDFGLNRENKNEADDQYIYHDYDDEPEEEQNPFEDKFSEWDRHWPRFYKPSTLQSLFISTLAGNDNFDIGGEGLKSYFTADDLPFGEPDFVIDLAVQMAEGINNKRLCKTSTGLLGSIPEHARLQDRVAILSNSDMPVLLRPKGQHFQLIGFCFIEGLMTGEVAERTKGKCPLQEISIC